MADTAAPTPTWLTLVMGFAPSLNQSLIVIVTAVVTFAGTLATQRLTAPRMDIPAADKPAPVPIQKQINDAVNRLDGRLTEAIGTAGLCVDEVQQLRKDFHTPRVKAKPAALAK